MSSLKTHHKNSPEQQWMYFMSQRLYSTSTYGFLDSNTRTLVGLYQDRVYDLCCRLWKVNVQHLHLKIIVVFCPFCTEYSYKVLLAECIHGDIRFLRGSEFEISHETVFQRDTTHPSTEKWQRKLWKIRFRGEVSAVRRNDL